MRARFRTLTRAVGATLICVLLLTQVGCATLQWSPSFKPGSDEPGPTNPRDRELDGASTGKVISLAVVAVFGGYLVYKALTADTPEEDGTPEPDSLRIEYGTTDPPPATRPPVCEREKIGQATQR